jgi:hypothetical protein
MNLGVSELIIVFIMLAVGAVFLGITIWGIVDAAKRGQTGWIIGMVAGLVFGFGWILALVYLLAIRPGLVQVQDFRPPPPYDPFNPPGS